MIRTITSFVDLNIAYNITSVNKETYENASLLRERLIRLVQDLSVYEECSQQHFVEALAGITDELIAQDMRKCFDNIFAVTFNPKYGRQLREAASVVYRLETVLRYELVEDAPRGANPELVLRLNLYEKAIRKPFYQFIVFFSNTSHGDAYHIDIWPEIPDARMAGVR
jgi:hypothetical protein